MPYRCSKGCLARGRAIPSHVWAGANMTSMASRRYSELRGNRCFEVVWVAPALTLGGAAGRGLRLYDCGPSYTKLGRLNLDLTTTAFGPEDPPETCLVNLQIVESPPGCAPHLPNPSAGSSVTGVMFIPPLVCADAMPPAWHSHTATVECVWARIAYLAYGRTLFAPSSKWAKVCARRWMPPDPRHGRRANEIWPPPPIATPCMPDGFNSSMSRLRFRPQLKSGANRADALPSHSLRARPMARQCT